MPGSEYVIKYISDLTDATAGAKEVERVNADMAKTISSDFQQATRVLGTSLDKISETPIKLKGGEQAIKTVSQLGTVIQTSDGSFKEFTKTQTFINGELTKTSGSLKDVTGQFGRTAVESAKASKNTLSLGENLGRLAKRAILTIPLWLALRSAIMGTFRVIRDGLKTIEDQDRAFQKAKRTLQGTTADIERNFEKLREAVTKLSIETGESVEKITNAFYKFSTVGFDFETSMKGAEYAVKSAIVQFGDAEETANAFARAMRVLVDRSEGATSAGEQIAEAMALTTKLWETNAFELSEFTQSLEKFAGTAKATNFTTQQTIALLASLSTAGLRGGRAGTLLRSSIVKLLTNLDKLSGTLGIKVNPQLDSTFDVLMRVLDAIQGLDEGSQVAEQTANVIGKIFGGVRGMEAVLALKALRTELLKNVETVGGVGELNEKFEEVSDTISRLIPKIRNANKELGKQFVQEALGGATKYRDTLKAVNEYQEKFVKDASAGITRMEALGASFNTLIRTVAFLPSILASIATFGKVGLVSPFEPLFELEERKLRRAVQRMDEFGEKLVKGLQGKLSKTELTELLTDFKVKIKENNFQLDDNALIRVEGELRKKLQEIANKAPAEIETKVVQRKLTIEEEQDVAKLVLDIELDRLKILGATNSQLLKAEDLYSRQLNIEETSLDKVKRKLELEKAINEEKRVQNKLGSDSIKLFEIAQTEGEDMARKIGEALADEDIFARVLRMGGETAEILGREFADKVQQFQAQQFFKGERVTGKPELRGGFRVSIEEEAIRGISRITPTAVAPQVRAEREFRRIEELKVQVEAPIQINANIDASQLNEVQQVFVDKVAQQLPQVGSKINKALAQALGNKQNQVL